MPNETSPLLREILNRRSTGKLTTPVPNTEELKLIFQAAVTVPDHGQLHPYRFIAISGEERELFAEGLLQSAKEIGEVNETMEKKVRKKAYAAPMQLIIIFSPKESKIPEWEQMATCSCTGYAMSLAANSLGYDTIWKSIGVGAGSQLRELFNMTPTESLMGWINIGTSETKTDSKLNRIKTNQVSFALKSANLEPIG